MDDIELLREYSVRNSEPAFEALVNRYVNLVYSAAYRQVHDPSLAAEVTQTVFIILAKKAYDFRPETIVSGWLYRTTRLVAIRAIRTEHRRREREQEAARMEPDQPDLRWEQIAPFLDEAMSSLRDIDRNAVVLRFFENRSLRDIGAVLGTTEDTAQKRVARALDKLRTFFGQRGVLLSTSALAAVLSTNAVQAAPAGVASAALAAALLKGTASTTSTLTLLKGTLKIMAWTKLKIATITTLVLLTGSITVVMVQRKLADARQTEAATQPRQRSGWRDALASGNLSPEQVQQTEKMGCIDNLKQIGAALKGWATDHQKVFPAALDSLGDYLSSPTYLTCPGDHGKNEAPSWKEFSPGKISYMMVSPGAKNDRPNLIVAKCPIHGTVVLSEGRVFSGDYIEQQGMHIMPDNTLQ